MRILLFYFLFVFSSVGHAQQFGGHPPRQKWKYLDLSPVRVVFPTGWDTTALRVAAVMKALHAANDSLPLPHQTTAPVLLQHQTMIANGYVALAPFRSEWYLTPPSNPFSLGSIPWAEQLALHEYRHIQQYEQYNTGGSRVFRWVLGEQGQALANALTVPDWFFEGDAVFQETLFSKQGRGRLPYFYNGYRSLWEAGKNYSYQKLRNGSYKDYVPNHYQLGYLMVMDLRKNFGWNSWEKITSDAAAMRGVFYPFQRAFKKQTDTPFKVFRAEAIKRNQQALTGQLVKPADQGHQPVVMEENPVYSKTGDLVMQLSSYQRIPAFYIRKPDGEKQRVRTRDRSLDTYFSYANGKLVYSAYRPNARWGWIDYGELNVLDIASGKQDRITRKTKFQSPGISPLADSIVAVELTPQGQSVLNVLTIEGRLLKKIANDSGWVYGHPSFFKNGAVSATRNRNGFMALQWIDLATGVHQLLTPWSNKVVGYPSVNGDSVFFSVAVNGKDRSALLLNNRVAVLDEAGSSAGQYQPTVLGDSISWAQFTAYGMKIRTDRVRPGRWVSADDFAALPIWPEEEFEQHAPSNFLDTLAPETVPVHTYKQGLHLLRFHSWTPWFEEPEFSLTAHSQNLLNTFQADVYGVYNRNEGFTRVGFSGVYGKWFPYLRGGVSYTFNRRGTYRSRIIQWNELEAQAGAQVPLNLSRGRQISFLQLATDLVWNQPYFRMPEKDSLGSRSYAYLFPRVSFTIQQQQAVQQIFPSWAQSIQLQYRATINRYNSQQWLFASNSYLPGLTKTHSLVAHVAIGGRDSLPGIRFSDNFPFARGYESINWYRAERYGATYHFPVAYPDKGLAQVVYLLRVRMAGFYDWARVRDARLGSLNPVSFRSTGLECYFDTRWWNQLPVSFGIRYAHLLDRDRAGGTGNNRWQFILPVNLLPGRAATKQPNALPGF